MKSRFRSCSRSRSARPNRLATSDTRTPGCRMMYGTAASRRRSLIDARGVARPLAADGGAARSGTDVAREERLQAGHHVIADGPRREYARVRPEGEHPGHERLRLARRYLDLDPAVPTRPD